MADARRPVFLSAHYDDAVLSCGGTIAALAEGGTPPLIVTCFGGVPSGRLSDFARFQHERWGFGLEEAVAGRRREEEAAAAAIGAEVLWLDFLDAIYRDARYTSDDDLFGQVHPDDVNLAEAIVEKLSALLARRAIRPGRIYIPLGMGNHVDHQVLVSVGRRLAASGHTIWAYEDYPYAGDPQVQPRLLERAREISGREPVVCYLTKSQMERRVEATLCYRSQLHVIFRFQGDPVESTWRYAMSVGDGRPAERFWPLSG